MDPLSLQWIVRETHYTWTTSEYFLSPVLSTNERFINFGDSEVWMTGEEVSGHNGDANVAEAHSGGGGGGV